jgi:hypothetical protein
LLEYRAAALHEGRHRQSVHELQAASTGPRGMNVSPWKIFDSAPAYALVILLAVATLVGGALFVFRPTLLELFEFLALLVVLSLLYRFSSKRGDPIRRSRRRS